MKISAFKFFRILALLLILLAVWSTATTQKRILQSWQGTIEIAVIPIVADDKPQTRDYIQQLRTSHYNDIIDFVNREGSRFNSSLKHSININLSQAVDNLPPSIPDQSASRLGIILWSLRLRWWAFQNKPKGHGDTQIRLYVLYSSPAENELLPHSTGLQKGLIGIIHARAKPNKASHNNVVIAHELLHIFGATDKYDLSNNLAIYPNGYAEPNRKPTHPQRFAEIMAARIPITKQRQVPPNHLKRVIVGPLTAQEIGWLGEQGD